MKDGSGCRDAERGLQVSGGGRVGILEWLGCGGLGLISGRALVSGEPRHDSGSGTGPTNTAPGVQIRRSVLFTSGAASRSGNIG